LLLLLLILKFDGTLFSDLKYFSAEKHVV